MAPSRKPSRLTTFLEAIKFSHSIFALPFALIGMLVAADGVPGLWTMTWIVLAVVAARTAAMCFNRIVDREFDARNPRTASRALVTGELPVSFAWGALLASVLLYYACAALLNRLCFYLATPCLGVLLGYSLTKRFTSYSHLVLGLALGLAPVGAWIAVTGALAWTPIWLMLGVMSWVAGFDILYSCQDVEVDRREAGLHSLPKRLGVAGAMRVARGLHAGTVALLLVVLASASPPLGWLFALGVVGMGALLMYEHSLVSPDDLSAINAAFFTTNGIISAGLFVITSIDVLVLR